MKNSITVHYMFLGRGGGGANDLINMSLASVSLGHNVHIWVAADLDYEILNFLEDSSVFQIHLIYLPRDKTVSSIMKLGRSLKFLRDFSQLPRDASVFFVMPSPYDWFFHKVANFKDLKTCTLIHEVRNHPGDLWPNKFAISSRIRSSKTIVCYSRYVALMIERKFGLQVELLPVPTILDTKRPISTEISKIIQAARRDRLRVGFIGRVKAYKGLEVEQQINENHFQDIDFFFFGIGIDNRVRSPFVITVDRWFNQSEILEFIKFIDVLIMPYTSASQSGLIPTAMFLNKWIYASSEGGLVEQLSNYSRASLIPTDSRHLIFDLILDDYKSGRIVIDRENLFEGSQSSLYVSTLSRILNISRGSF